jgi:hypothetical protein
VTTIYRELSERIRGEVPDLDRLISRVRRSWEGARRSTDQQDVYLDSVALNLHGFYSGVEHLFELIVRHIDRDRELATGESWHQDLLQRMKKDIQQTRPAIISDASASVLGELRRFRHLVRNIYTSNLIPEKIEPLVSSLPESWSRLRAELLAFADFLEDVAEASEN